MKKKMKKELLVILWVKLKDNFNCEKMSYNFIKDKHNP